VINKSGGCSIYSLKANLSPKKRHKNYIVSNSWAFRSKKQQKIIVGTWHSRAKLGTDRACHSGQKQQKGVNGRARSCLWRHGPCQASWSSKARLNKGARPGLCQALPCLIFLHRIFIFFASINPESCSRSFLSLTMLQNPFFSSKTQSFTIFFPEIK